MSDREKLVDKLKKMYAHAKSAEAIGSEAEAQAFAAQIQRLLSEHKINRSEIEEQRLDETDPIGQHAVDFESAGIEVKRRRIEWQEILGQIVAKANFCKLMVSQGTSQVWFLGRETDAMAAEQVFLYLLRIANSLADKEYVKYFYECKERGCVEEARGFRASYLAGFCNRLAARYREEQERIRREHASSGTALVRLSDAMTHVENYLKQRGSKTASGFTAAKPNVNQEGLRRGRAAADKIALGPKKEVTA